MSNNKERSTLEFQEAVRKHFAFAEDQYGLKCISTDMYIVKYKSDKVYLNVYHERVSYELYFEIGMLPEEYNNPLRVDTNYIVTICCVSDESAFYQASTKDAVYRIVEKLSHLARMYAKDAFNASVQYFKDAANYRRQRQDENLYNMKLRAAESKAQSAWDCKDYKAVVDIYSMIENELSPLQLKKLDYAKKRLTHE